MLYRHQLIEQAPEKIGVFTPVFTELDIIEFDGQLQSIKSHLEKTPNIVLLFSQSIAKLKVMKHVKEYS